MLIEEYRGEVLENTHDGRICVVDGNGRVIYGTGDVNAFTYYRSASKPFQVLPVLMRGLDKKYGLTAAELTVCCASHAAEDIHVLAVESIMKKAGLKEEYLVMKPDLPFNLDARNHIIKNNLPKRKVYHNCSGKHTALMILQRELTGSHENYERLDSPAQQEVLRTVAEVSNFPAQNVMCGIDGCGVPVFAVPLKCIATAFMKLAYPDADKKYSAALKKIAECIAENPYYIGGHGRICGEINTLKNYVGKVGAEGAYGLGLKKQRLGIAVKVADGSGETHPLIIAEILRQIGVDDKEAFDVLGKLKSPIKTNHNDREIGSYKTVFKLNKLDFDK